MTDPHSTSPQYGNTPTWGEATSPDPSLAWTPSYSPQDSETDASRIIPFHPLSIADIFSGTVNAIRANPVFHFAMTAGAMTFVGIASGIQVAYTSDLFRLTERAFLFSPPGTDLFEKFTQIPLLPSLLLCVLTLILSFLVSTFLTGMLSCAISDSLIAHKPSMHETWKRVRPRLGSLLGTALLTSLLSFAFLTSASALVFALMFGAWTVVSQATDLFIVWLIVFISVGLIAALLILSAFLVLVIRLSFAALICVLEGRSPAESISRSWSLTRGAFGRLLGRYFLMFLTLSTLSSLVVGILSGVMTGLVLLLNSPVFDGVATALSVVCAGIAFPVQVAYTTLMYTDERMRSEGFAQRLTAARENARSCSPYSSSF